MIVDVLLGLLAVAVLVGFVTDVLFDWSHGWTRWTRWDDR